MGRPSIFTQAIADEICERISDGETLRQICRDAHMPHFTTVYDWRESNEEFCLRLARARKIGKRAIEQEILEIADDARNDWMEKFDQDGLPAGWVLNGEHVQRSKLRIETRLKLLKVWDPQRHGDKVQLTGDPDAPLQTNSTVTLVPSEAYMKLVKGE